MSIINRPKDNRAKTRKKRPPVNGRGDVLKLSGMEDGYVYRTFNDVGTRIAQFKEYGWETVSSDDITIGTRNNVKAGEIASVTVDSSNGTQGIIMRIPKEWYDEDQKAKQDAIAVTEEQITGESEKDGNYGKVSIER